MIILLNVIGLLAFTSVVAGVFLQFGLAITLMLGGGAVLVFSIRALSLVKRQVARGQ